MKPTLAPRSLFQIGNQDPESVDLLFFLTAIWASFRYH
ncbi:hypothetical protein VCHENC02_3587 [Vibrio harveyi]|uniref:Uncharacterized protein n=1 Tax=Vibrio harveyi TaxID=669 RepID=A0A454CWE2_VIBHA|nr:hypothetical protein VCHENC02_3587 [Vibrio harveyi]